MTGFGDVLDMECEIKKGIKDGLKSEQLSTLDKAMMKTLKVV